MVVRVSLEDRRILKRLRLMPRVGGRTPGERALGFGAPLAAGEVAFALPVDPSQAVGAALAPGARVDVIAVPNALKTGTATGTTASPPAAQVMG